MDKKEGTLFDVTLGTYNNAEECKLVRGFLLYQLSNKYNKENIGLY